MDNNKVDDTHGYRSKHAVLVGGGIFLSKIAGFVRERVFAYYLGNTDAADIFRAALRIPNVLQNLLGEGVLSASFIPVYTGLISRGNPAEARRLSSTIAVLLLIVSLFSVLAGVTFAPQLTALIAPGFDGAKHEAAVSLVRILFPAMGMLVLSAWCLGVLNSHRRFFLPYAAPVIWNVAIIGAMALGAAALRAATVPTSAIVGFEIAEAAAWGVFAGSLLQVLIQLPAVIKEMSGIDFVCDLRLSSVRETVRNFVPVVIGRGVVQISAYVDSLIASLLPAGSVAALGYAQTIYLVPIGLFSMSVSAAQLPAMSSAVATAEAKHDELRMQIRSGVERIVFFIVPSTFLLIFAGDILVGALFQTGRFTAADTSYVWGILIAASLGLIPASLSRMYVSGFYALRDTTTPFRCSLIRVLLSVALGTFLALRGPALLGIEPRFGVALLALAGAAAGWLEYLLLRSVLRRRIGAIGGEPGLVLKLFLVAGIATGGFLSVADLLENTHLLFRASAGSFLFIIVYFAAASAFGVTIAREILSRIKRRMSRALS